MSECRAIQSVRLDAEDWWDHLSDAARGHLSAHDRSRHLELVMTTLKTGYDRGIEQMEGDPHAMNSDLLVTVMLDGKETRHALHISAEQFYSEGHVEAHINLDKPRQA